MNQALISDPKEFWKSVLGQVEIEISPMVYKTMISRTKGVSFDKNTLEVFCEDNFVKKNPTNRFCIQMAFHHIFYLRKRRN